MERKDFLKKGLALCGLSMIPAGLMQSCGKTSNSGPTNVNFTLDLTQAANSSLNTIGGNMTINGLIIIRTSATVFSALSAACTHQGCTVNYISSTAILRCPCHGGTFNATTGAVLGGPPPSPLSTYKTSLSGNILTVTS